MKKLGSGGNPDEAVWLVVREPPSSQAPWIGSQLTFTSHIIQLNSSVTQFSHPQSRNDIYFLGVLQGVND